MSEEVLGELRSAGRLDSVGDFTLEASRAREILARFRLRDPREYVLLLVSSAVAAGAARIRLSVRPLELVLEHDGRAPTPEELEDLFSAPLLGRRGRPDLRDLALGLQAARALPAAGVVLEAWEGTSSVRLDLARPRPRVRALPQARPRGLRLEVRERLGLEALGRLIRSVASALPEEVLLEERCRLSAAWIQVNERSVPRSFSPGRCVAWCRLRGPVDLPGAHLPAADPRSVVHRDAPSPGAFTAVLALGGSFPDPGVDLVVHGVSWRAPMDLGFDDLVCAVAAPELHLDVSRTAVVRDRDFEALQAVLRQEVRGLTERVLGRWEEFQRTELAEGAGRLLESLARRLHAEGRSAEAATALEKSLTLQRGRGGDGQDLACALLLMAEMVRDGGQRWEGVNLVCQAFDELRGRLVSDPEWAGRFRPRSELYRRIAEVERLSGRDVLRVADSLFSLAEAMAARGLAEEAEPVALKAANIFRLRLPAEEPRRVEAVYLLARILESLSLKTRAAEAYREILQALSEAAQGHLRRKDAWGLRMTRERLYRASRCLHGDLDPITFRRKADLVEACEEVGDQESAALFRRWVPPD